MGEIGSIGIGGVLHNALGELLVSFQSTFGVETNEAEMWAIKEGY